MLSDQKCFGKSSTTFWAIIGGTRAVLTCRIRRASQREPLELSRLTLFAMYCKYKVNSTTSTTSYTAIILDN